MSYIGAEPDGKGSAERFIFTATGTTPTITHDDDGLPISYEANHVSVYLNGVKQVVGTDVTASNGSTLVFASNLSEDDVIECIALSSFSPADTVPATGGTFSGSVTCAAGLVANTADINGGTFDGIVGGTTPAAGSFTTINASGGIVVEGLTIGEGNNSQTGNTAIGVNALDSITSSNYNTGLGIQSGEDLTDGHSNTVLGAYALLQGTDNTENVAVGKGAMWLTTTTADRCVAVGKDALSNVTTGSYNIGVGYKAGDNITSGSSNITIGASQDADSATGSNQLNIGGVIYADLSTGDIWTKTTGKIKQKGAFMQSSTHQALTLGY